MATPKESPVKSFQPAHQQRWDLLHSFAQDLDSHSAHFELRWWGLLAMLSLGIAGIFALLLALCRVPGVEEILPWPIKFFEKGLVIHVILSFVVWFLTILGAFTTIVSYRLSDGCLKWEALGPSAIKGSFLATILLLVPAWLDRGEPSLNNYIPVIIDEIYYIGLIILALSILLVVVRMIYNLIGCKGPFEPINLLVISAGFIYLLALSCFSIAFLIIVNNLSIIKMTPAINEDLFWGGGHILQFVNVGLLLSAWYFLVGLYLKKTWVRTDLVILVVGLLVSSSLIGPSLYFIYEPFSLAQNKSFTYMQFLLIPSPIIFAIAGIFSIFLCRNSKILDWKSLTLHCFLLSILVFLLGSFLGLFVDGTDTRTPAHYHGVIGGINIAFMGLFYCFFLPLIERGINKEKFAFASIWMYAVGQTFHSLGLFLAGGYGAPRKVAGSIQSIEDIGANFGLYLMGIGAIIAVIGGIIFIFLVTQALLKKI